MMASKQGNGLRHMTGVTLVEMMVALGIGSMLIAGALTVYIQSKSSYLVNESISRMQENARFALDTMEPDLRLASFWGQTSRAFAVQGRATPLQPIPVGLGAAPIDCGVNWTLNVNIPIGGSNNGYALACAPFAGGPAAATSDVLVVRHSNPTPVVPAAGRLQIQSDRMRGQIFLGGGIPAGFNPVTSITTTVAVNGYYVSTASVGGVTLPSLRRKTLQAGPALVDQEVIHGVEDMQIELGVDISPPGTVQRGTVNFYLNPGDPRITPGAAAFIPNSQVVAVRIWLLMRAERTERGYADTNAYVYADINRPPPNDGFRRLLVSKTILLRNVRA